MNNKLIALTCICLIAFSSLIVSANAKTINQNTITTKDAQAVNDFGLKLYNKLYSDKENVFISPVSVYLALGMLSNGAASNTQKQLLSSLYPGNTALNLNILNKNMQNYITTGRPNTTINIANSIWIRDKFFNSVKSNFLTTNKTYYNSTIKGLDFSNNKAVDTINKWASDNTKGLIKQVLDKQIGSDVMMYLLNAVYFKADWQIPFNKASTVKSDFTTPKGKVSINMMNTKKFFSYYENNLFQMVSLPYKDGKTSMAIILPKTNLTSVKNNLNANNLSQWIKSMKSNEVVLSLPKVNTQYKQGLKSALTSLGMADMFEKNKANFKNISQDNLFVSDATHSTVLKIDELGTEAAAVTSIEMSTTSMPIDPPKVMNVNKPFYSIIYDNTTGLILFQGSITNPQ